MEPDIYFFSALLVASTMLTLVVGYARVLFSTHNAAFHIALSTCLVFFAFAARAWFWDLGPLFSDELRAYGRAHMTTINTIFNCLAVWGALHGHYALYLMIPDEDKSKHHWNIFTAWMYPPWLLFHEVDILVHKWMRKK